MGTTCTIFRTEDGAEYETLEEATEHEETRKQVKEAGIEDGFYHVRNCFICNSAIGYQILKSHPYFDCNCSCTSRPEPLEPRSFEEFLEGVSKEERMRER